MRYFQPYHVRHLLSELHGLALLGALQNHLDDPQDVTSPLWLDWHLPLTTQRFRELAVIVCISQRLDSWIGRSLWLAVDDCRECAVATLWVYAEALVSRALAGFELVFLDVKIILPSSVSILSARPRTRD